MHVCMYVCMYVCVYVPLSRARERSQLLVLGVCNTGYTSSNAGLYQPNSADTPIRPWLHSIGIDEPLGPVCRNM